MNKPKTPKPVRSSELVGLARLSLRKLVSSDRTPLFIARLVQMIRLGVNVKLRFRNPLRSIPELNIRWRSYFLHQSSGLSYEERARHLVMAVENLGTGVAGDVAEFGTMTGTTARYLAAGMAAFQSIGGHRNLHLFDSFQGFPKVNNEIDRQSYEVASGVWAEGECYGIGPRYLKAICAKFISKDRIIIHHGWFSDTLAQLPSSQKFGLVHIDCDLYQSSRDVLQDLFKNERLTDGAILLFDDWLCSRGTSGQRKAWLEIVEQFNPTFTFLGYYANACAKIIVHGNSDVTAQPNKKVSDGL
jgi:predicted O-methyltransferase YrrM